MGKDIFYRYLKNEKKYIILLVCIIGIGVGINGINPYIYGNIIDSITEMQRKDFEKWAIVFLVVLLLVQILEAVESIIGNFFVNHIENKMQECLMKKILFLKCEEIDKYTEGELLNRLEFDAEKIIGYYSDLLTGILKEKVNKFIDTLETSSCDSEWKPTTPVKPPFIDTESIRKLMAKRVRKK